MGQNVEFEVRFSTTEQDAMRQIARQLADFRQTHKAPTIIVLETPKVLETTPLADLTAVPVGWCRRPPYPL